MSEGSKLSLGQMEATRVSGGHSPSPSSRGPNCPVSGAMRVPPRNWVAEYLLYHVKMVQLFPWTCKHQK